MNYSFYKQAASLIRGNLEKRGELEHIEPTETPDLLKLVEAPEAIKNMFPEDNSDSENTPSNSVQFNTGPQVNNGITDRINKGVGTAVNTGLTALPFVFAGNHPSMEQGLATVEATNSANRELASSAAKNLPKLMADESSIITGQGLRNAASGAGRVFFNNIMPGIGLGLAYNGARAHWQSAVNDPSVIGKAVGAAQTGLDIGLGASDGAWLLSQLGTPLAKRAPWIAKSLPWLNRLAASGFRWCGPAMAASATWDLGNAYRLAQEQQLEAAVARQEQRDADDIAMAGFGDSARTNAREARKNLDTLAGNAKKYQVEDDRTKLDDAEKAIATNIAVNQSRAVSSLTDPTVFGSTTNLKPTREPLKIDVTAEHPVAENKSYVLPKPAPYHPPLMYSPPTKDQLDMYKEEKQQALDVSNAHPTQWVDKDGNTRTFSPEYYEQLSNQARHFNPTDYIPWWLRPFLGSAAPIPETSDNFKEDVNTSRSKLWGGMNDAMMKAQDSGF